MIPKYQEGNYIVKKGDNLSLIAKKYRISLKKLLEWNPQIKDANKIQIGLKIRITGGNSQLPKFLERPSDKINLPTIESTRSPEFIPKKTTQNTPKKKKYAYGKTSKKSVNNKQSKASVFSFNKLKNLGKNISDRVFGDKDIITGRNELLEKSYQRNYNTPYSLEMDRGEPIMEPYDFMGFTQYRHKEGPDGRPIYTSKVGNLGLFNRQIDKDGRVCYQIKDDNGNIVTDCSKTGNLITRALGIPTTGHAWNRHGIYGDSLIYGGLDHNKIYTRPIGKVINGLKPSQLDVNNLESGDFVDLYTEGSSHNSEAATGRGNSHTGTIFKPYGNTGSAYIIHNIGGSVYVDPLSSFGPIHTWSIMGIRRPGSKEHPYYEE